MQNHSSDDACVPECESSAASSGHTDACASAYEVFSDLGPQNSIKCSLLFELFASVPERISSITVDYESECQRVLDSFKRSLDLRLEEEKSETEKRRGRCAGDDGIQDLRDEVNCLGLVESDCESACYLSHRKIAEASQEREKQGSGRQELMRRLVETKSRTHELKDEIERLQVTAAPVVAAPSRVEQRTTDSPRLDLMRRIMCAGRAVRQAESRVRALKVMEVEENLLDRLLLLVDSTPVTA